MFDTAARIRKHKASSLPVELRYSVPGEMVTRVSRSSWLRSSPPTRCVHHWQMLVMVHIVPQAEYDAEMKRLAAIGQTGLIPVDASRKKMAPTDAATIPAPVQIGGN